VAGAAAWRANACACASAAAPAAVGAGIRAAAGAAGAVSPAPAAGDWGSDAAMAARVSGAGAKGKRENCIMRDNRAYHYDA
jgi:hypothetical protein